MIASPDHITSDSITMPASVFITGANGFIGRRLMERYRAAGAEVRGMDIKADPAANVVAGDLTRPGTWAAHALGCELFINTAAVVSLAADWDTYRRVSVRGVRNCIDVAVAAGSRRFVQFSSIAAYGWQYPDDVDEKADVVIGPDYRYGVSKGASEHVALAAHAAGEIECTIVRPGDVYGPGSRAWLVEPLKMAKAGALILPKHGNGIFTPVYVDDLLDGVMLAANLPQGSGQIFNICGNTPIPCKEFFAHHWRWAGRSGSPRLLSLPAAVALTWMVARFNQLFKRPSEVGPDTMYMFARSGNYSIEKAGRLLGYSPKVGLDEGMRRSEEWMRMSGFIE